MPITSLKLTNFTTFKYLDIEFSPGLNVIVGTNGTGKTHILQAAYSVIDWHRRSDGVSWETHVLQSFGVTALSSLGRFGTLDWCVHCYYAKDQTVPLAVYLPSQDLFTSPSVVLDSCRVSWSLSNLETVIGGSVSADGQFLETPSGKIAIHLVSEGFRTLSSLIQLVKCGYIRSGSTLFWDAPETHLNPENICLIARAIIHFVQLGVQVVLATHSLFLLRELHILTNKSINTCYIGLHKENPADAWSSVTVTQGTSIDDIGDIASLDEDLRQSDRYMWCDQCDRHACEGCPHADRPASGSSKA